MAKYAKNARTVEIYKDRTGKHWEAHTGVGQLKNGDVLVTFCETRGLAHEDFDTVFLVRSKDNGRTFDPSTKTQVWPLPGNPIREYYGSDCPLITQISDGTVLVNHLTTSFHRQEGILEDMGPQSENVGRMKGAEGTWISRSNDNGYTWEPGYPTNHEPLRWTMPADSILELPNGTLLMPVLGQLNTRRERKDQEPVRSSLFRSDDKGLHWEHWSTIAFDPAGIITFDEPALGRNKDGVLVCMMRTDHRPRGRHQHMWVAYSHNDGESWSRPEATNLWGYPADLVLLNDGRMLATYGYRRAPWGVRGCISEDGLSWDVANEIIIREGGVAPPTQRSWWHIGYPHSVQLQNSQIFSVDHQFTDREPFAQFVVGVLWDL
jgi:hypothetical protein